MLEAIDPIEIAIVILALAAVVISGLNLHSALLDQAATDRQGINGPVMMWANSAIWSEVTRIGKAVMLVAAGGILLTLPSGATDLWTGRLIETRDLFTVGYGAFLVVGSIHGFESRRLLRKSLKPGWDGTERRARQVPSPEGL